MSSYINFKDRVDFEVSQHLGLWFYRTNSQLFCSSLHVHFNTILDLDFKKVLAKFSLIFSWNRETFKSQRTPESRSSALAPSNLTLKSRNTTIVSRNRIKLYTRIQKILTRVRKPILMFTEFTTAITKTITDNNRSNIWKPQVQGGQLKKQRKETKGSTRPSLRRNWRPCIGDARLKRFSKRRTVYSLIQFRCIQWVVNE